MMTGKTGEFPKGKLNADDEGGLKMAVAADHAHGVVVINFGSPVKWIGLYPEDVKKLAAALLKKLEDLKQ